MIRALIALSVLGCLIGLFFASEATLGVAIIGVSANAAIWARIHQADKQTKQ